MELFNLISLDVPLLEGEAIALKLEKRREMITESCICMTSL